jgi:hypothetical protein
LSCPCCRDAPRRVLRPDPPRPSTPVPASTARGPQLARIRRGARSSPASKTPAAEAELPPRRSRQLAPPLTGRAGGSGRILEGPREARSS